MRTHYDNLKVAQNAPDFIIRASYKALLQKYHPDKFKDKKEQVDALRITQIIVKSFDVLSDPIKRAEHDEWIANYKDNTSDTDTTNDGNYDDDIKNNTNDINNKTDFYHDEFQFQLRLNVVFACIKILLVIFLFIVAKDFLFDSIKNRHRNSVSNSNYSEKNEALTNFSKSPSFQTTDSVNFEDYPVTEIYHGKTAKALVSEPQARYYRTQLKDAIKREIEFAGEYVFASWGCGTGCSYGAAISKKTGEAIFFPNPKFYPVSNCYGKGYTQNDEWFNYNKNSRLIKTVGSDDFMSTDYYVGFYEFNGRGFKLVKSFPLNCEGL